MKSLFHRISKGRGWAFCSSRSASSATKVELDGSVRERIESSELHPKRHPGAMRNVNTQLPQDIQAAMLKTVGDVSKKVLVDEAGKFCKYLHGRKPPLEEEQEHELVRGIKREVEEGLNVNLEDVNDDMREYYKKVIESKVEQITKQRKYNWQQLEFSRHMGLQYMVARSDREYAINYQVMKELKTRFQYSPKTIFDFGSGVGSVLWAADTLWGPSLKEAFAVDASPHMNEIAREMLTHANLKNLKKILFQRQFLPMSNTPKYDVVVSSFSLLELPSVSSRLETVANLWNKTEDFLVLIEFGTMAGFQVIHEARDFLIWGMKKGSSPKGHVVAPCPHDKKCPLRTSGDNRPCNFSATFTAYPQKPAVKKELYSYVILKKGNKLADDQDWPRIIRPILRRHKHAICRLCTPQGRYSEVVFTPSKHGKVTFRCARQSKWGDRLPLSIQDDPNNSETTTHSSLEDSENDVTNSLEEMGHSEKDSDVISSSEEMSHSEVK